MKTIMVLLLLAGMISAQYIDGNFGNLSAHGTLFSAEEIGAAGYLIDTSDSTFTVGSDIGYFPVYSFYSYATLTLPSDEWIKYIELSMGVSTVSLEDSVTVWLAMIEMNDDSTYEAAPVGSTWGTSPAIWTSDSLLITVPAGSPESGVFEFSPAFQVPSTGLYGLWVGVAGDTTDCGIIYEVEGDAEYQDISHAISKGASYTNHRGYFYARFWCPPHASEFDGKLINTGVIFEDSWLIQVINESIVMTWDSTGAVDVIGDFTAGTIEADNGTDEAAWVIQVGDTLEIVGGVIVDIAHP